MQWLRRRLVGDALCDLSPYAVAAAARGPARGLLIACALAPAAAAGESAARPRFAALRTPAAAARKAALGTGSADVLAVATGARRSALGVAGAAHRAVALPAGVRPASLGRVGARGSRRGRGIGHGDDARRQRIGGWPLRLGRRAAERQQQRCEVTASHRCRPVECRPAESIALVRPSTGRRRSRDARPRARCPRSRPRRRCAWSAGSPRPRWHRRWPRAPARAAGPAPSGPDRCR